MNSLIIHNDNVIDNEQFTLEKKFTQNYSDIDKYISQYNFSGKTFRFDRGYEETPEEKFDPFTDYVFWDEQSLKNVRTTHFIDDFNKIQLDSQQLMDLIDDMKTEATNDFMKFYNANKSRYL